MNRRECLKALAALGASLSLFALSQESASENDINKAWQALHSSSHHGLADHPRVLLLRNDVLNLPVDNEYKAHLLNSIDLYYDHIVNRPVYAHEEAWDDLEAIQQVTLGDLNENGSGSNNPSQRITKRNQVPKNHEPSIFIPSRTIRY